MHSGYRIELKDVKCALPKSDDVARGAHTELAIALAIQVSYFTSRQLSSPDRAVLCYDLCPNEICSFVVAEECCRSGTRYALERPTEILMCRTEPSLTCESKRDELCCECCNFGTLSFNAAQEFGCELNRNAFFGDCREIFDECCYGRGK